MKKLAMMFLLGLILAGCGAGAPTATPAGTAGPQQTPQAAGLGAVQGVLVDEQGAPIEGVGVYVAKISVDGIISFSPEADPRAITDAEGRFTIANVAPATYAMAYWTPGPSGLIYDPAKPDLAVQVEVRAEETASAGSLKIKRP